MDCSMDQNTLFRAVEEKEVAPEIAPEIALRIVEAAMGEDPNIVACLMQVSKTFNSLLENYQNSVLKTLLSGDSRMAHVNVQQSEVLSSIHKPGTNLPIQSFTYPWYSEMRSRAALIECLANHEITNMEEASCSWPFGEVDKKERLPMEQEFKLKSFLLLFQLSDCTAGLTKTAQIRQCQAKFLESLSATKLAMLGCMVEVLGQGFFITTKTEITQLTRHNNISQGSEISKTPSEVTAWVSQYSQLAIPTHLPNPDDNWLRECMCVFEDRVQRYGPYLAWAYIIGAGDKKARSWAKTMLEQGLNDMNDFELGYTMSFASLQSVVWKVFCRKTECHKDDSWAKAKELVEKEFSCPQTEDD